jgi:hypothetical protein
MDAFGAVELPKTRLVYFALNLIDEININETTSHLKHDFVEG